VGDVANANILSINSPSGIYNIGTQIETSVNDLITTLRKVTKREFKVEYSPPRAGEVLRIYLDIQFAKRVLGWSPNVNLEDGIHQTWKWFNDRDS